MKIESISGIKQKTSLETVLQENTDFFFYYSKIGVKSGLVGNFVPEEIIEDIMHDIWIKCFTLKEKNNNHNKGNIYFDNDAHAAKWIITVSRNFTIDFIVRKNKNSVMPRLSKYFYDQGNTNDEGLEKDEDFNIFLSYIKKRISAQQWTVLNARINSDGENLTPFKKIEEKTGINPNTARGYTRQVRIMVGNILKQLPHITLPIQRGSVTH